MEPLYFAARPMARFRGLLGPKKSPREVLFYPCSDIHTLGMHLNIDVAFVDASGVVLESFREVPPRRRLRNRSAVAVLERYACKESPWFVSGDRLALTTYLDR